jgi:uncharacterized protein YutE (UPF0331/DUF86 family)
VLDRDLVLAKVETLERCLARIAEVRQQPPTRALDLQDVVVLNLQRAVQAMIDLAAHVVAREALGLPDSLGANFTSLEHAGVIGGELAEHMRRMTGFRNVAVHEYRRLDPAVLDGIVRERLGDLRNFAAAIVERLGRPLGER